jgi:hypothetical protein
MQFCVCNLFATICVTLLILIRYHNIVIDNKGIFMIKYVSV